MTTSNAAASRSRWGTKPFSASKPGRTDTSSKAVLTDMVQHIVEVAHPERILLFGSVARGEAGPRSDHDFLVVVRPRPGMVRRRLTRKILRRLAELPQPADVVVVTTEDVERYGDCPALIIKPALTEGKVVYAA